MSKIGHIKKVCGFYISSVHLITMILPYISKQLNSGNRFTSFLEVDLNENVEAILSKTALTKTIKQKVQDIKWDISNTYKYSYIESELKKSLESDSGLNIIIAGKEEYIDRINQNLDKFIMNNTKILEGKEITTISCYESTQFQDNIKDILDKHDYIINTAGINKVKEIFEGYEKRIAN